VEQARPTSRLKNNGFNYAADEQTNLQQMTQLKNFKTERNMFSIEKDNSNFYPPISDIQVSFDIP
jgi:hypothetical protein